MTTEKTRIKFEYFGKVEGADWKRVCIPFETVPGCGVGKRYFSVGEKPLSYTALRGVAWEGQRNFNMWLSRNTIIGGFVKLPSFFLATKQELYLDIENRILKFLFEEEETPILILNGIKVKKAKDMLDEDDR